MGAEPSSLDTWVAELSEALGLPAGLERQIPAVLDLARDAAHNVARPAAPLTAFLVGLAAGRNGGTDENLRVALATAVNLAQKMPNPGP